MFRWGIEKEAEKGKKCIRVGEKTRYWTHIEFIYGFIHGICRIKGYR